jgi:hypothetical protein
MSLRTNFNKNVIQGIPGTAAQKSPRLPRLFERNGLFHGLSIGITIKTLSSSSGTLSTSYIGTQWFSGAARASDDKNVAISSSCGCLLG